ncbi:MAG: peptidylprolyl isomerase [Gammaproteobacteria bacterium]|nr:peptidylprolyl isomerase [Gammaproteobacteria bacterium]
MKAVRLLILFGCLCGTSDLHAQTRELSSTGEMLDGIAAVVNDGVVLKSQLEIEIQRIVQRLEAQGTQIPPMNTLAEQVLERLVVNQIQLQRAQRVGIQISDETLNVALANVAQRNGTSLSELPAMLASEGIDYAAYRAEMREQLSIEQLRQRDVTGRIGITPRELEEYLERQEGRAFQNQEFNLSQILISISASATAEDVETAEREIADIYKQVQAGESFVELAISRSDGQNALEGGHLGWRKGEELPTLFAEIVPGLEIGQVSEPVRSASGFHLVKLDDRRGSDPIMQQQTRARHILISTNEVLDDEAVYQKLLELRQQILDGDSFEAVAKVISEDPGSAVDGGDLGWAGPDVFVPEFQAVCDELEIDEISKPFKTSYGWHIIQLLDRRVHDTTEEIQRQRAIMSIRNSKMSEETELWMRRLRDEAFVEYRL